AEDYAAVVSDIPIRFRDEVSRLKDTTDHPWERVETKSDSREYWSGYSKAWHWLEDNILQHLDKDSKLTLRRCYRKAFGEPNSNGTFFTGQTALAREVGLSKRRIQDILEIFNLLEWVVKTAHHNRGELKGTQYEMRLPHQAAIMFKT